MPQVSNQATSTKVSDSSDQSSTAAVGLAIRRLALPVYIPDFLVQVGAGMLLPVLPLALKAEGLSYLTITVVLAATGLGALLSQIPLGRLLAKRSELQLMIGSAIVLCAAVTLLGIAKTAVAFFILRLIAGIGSTGGILARQTYMTRTVQGEVRGRAMSLFGGLNRVAFLIGPLLGGFIADRRGFATAFAVAGFATITGIVPLVIESRRNPAPTTPPPSTSRDQRSRPLAVFRVHGRTLASAGAAQTCIMGVRYGRFIILPLIGDSIGLGTADIGILLSIGSAADMALFPVSGFLMDRFGRLSAIVPSFSLLGIGLILLAFADSHLTIVLAATVIGVGNGLGAGTMLTISSDLAPQESPGEFLAALGTIREVGRILVPLGVGLLADNTGLGSAAVGLSAVAFTGVTIMVLAVGETRNVDNLKGMKAST